MLCFLPRSFSLSWALQTPSSTHLAVATHLSFSSPGTEDAEFHSSCLSDPSPFSFSPVVIMSFSSFNVVSGLGTDSRLFTSIFQHNDAMSITRCGDGSTDAVLRLNRNNAMAHLKQWLHKSNGSTDVIPWLSESTVTTPRLQHK
jgi:hypothetical protein